MQDKLTFFLDQGLPIETQIQNRLKSFPFDLGALLSFGREGRDFFGPREKNVMTVGRRNEKGKKRVDLFGEKSLMNGIQCTI